LCVEEYIPLRIKELCKKRGYTKYRLAQITGMTQTALGNILNQKSLPTIVNLERICDAFGITLAQFFTDDGSKLNLTQDQQEILDIWDDLESKEREILIGFIRSLKK
jgi:transcriptional regulator with XRE-family HTH domain